MVVVMSRRSVCDSRILYSRFRLLLLLVLWIGLSGGR